MIEKDPSLTRTEASEAVTTAGWRYILGQFRTAVPVDSLGAGVSVAELAVTAAGADADAHLLLDLRADRVLLTVQEFGRAMVTVRDAEIVRRVSVALRAAGHEPGPSAGERSLQLMEIAIDALDAAAIRPFWKAVLGYTDEGSHTGPTDPLVDPLWQGPAVWFQRMDAPRPQRNRIHFDVSVPHDVAEVRLREALAAGGTLLSDTHAPAFWVLADPEGNEACITTWQNRE